MSFVEASLEEELLRRPSESLNLIPGLWTKRAKLLIFAGAAQPFKDGRGDGLAGTRSTPHVKRAIFIQNGGRFTLITAR